MENLSYKSKIKAKVKGEKNTAQILFGMHSVLVNDGHDDDHCVT